MIGTKLAHYEITSRLGSGGMGDVYQASDSKLGRSVAIKLLPEAFSHDKDWAARFEREARVLASLNHPHIASIYGIEEANQRKFLVMELVPGQTLAERIKRGPLPIDEALSIAKQIAEALEAAHDKGIIHRDLKPANIKFAEGNVKVLDFGLAKVLETEGSGTNLSNSPTMMTSHPGMLMGTPAYMSPEQAKGKPVDKRADIWAFGVVLYEMLTGEPLHQGETLSETLAAVLKETPDLNRVPAQVRPLLRNCLRKDAKLRLHDIADAKLLLDEGGAAEAPRQGVRATGFNRWVWSAVSGLLVLTATALAVTLFRQTPAVALAVRLQVPVPEGLTFNAGTQAAISPDGRWLAFPAAGPDDISRYYLRALNSLEVKPLPGSEGIIQNAPPPFWSYDSRFVVYGAGGRLKKSEVSGVPAQTIADTGLPFVQGGTWSRDGVILYAKNTSNLMQVSANGGTPVPVTVMAPGETAHRWPQFLPDGRRFLYLRVSGSTEKTGIYVGSLDTKPEDQNMQLLLRTDRQAWWVTSETRGESFILTQQERTLLAQPFNTATLALSGTPVPIASEVGSWPQATAGLWSVARSGALTYRSGGAGLPQLTWRDFTGKTLGVVGEPETYSSVGLAVSPDSERVAFVLTDTQGNQDVWVRDTVRGSNTRRLTFDPRRDDAPVWSPDGTKIVFAANRGGSMDLYEKNADGSGNEKLLFKSDQDKTPTSWSRDGRFLLFQSVDPKTAEDLWILPLSGDKPFVFLKTEDSEQFGQFSPDGRWIAYYSPASGNYQVYVRPFLPESNSIAGPASTQWMVSTTNGLWPRWSSDAKRLYYIDQSGAFMTVDVQAGTSFQYGAPRRLFSSVPPRQAWDATRGDRFLFEPTSAPTGPQVPFTVLLNWQAELKK